MAFIHYPPALPTTPAEFNHQGVVVGYQAECVYGMFGDPNATAHSMKSQRQRLVLDDLGAGITGFASFGMSACSAVFLRSEIDTGVIGAVVHYDSYGDPGEIFKKVLGYYNQNNAFGIVLAETYLAKHGSCDMTGGSAYASLERAGFNVYGQFTHNGSACMNQDGFVFDNYT